MRRAVLGFAERAGRLDVLVNNAAWVRYQAIPDVAPETVDRMVEIGFKAVIWGIQAAAEVMHPERGGAIVNLASVAGIVSQRNSIVYSGIKAGVMEITRAAAAGARRPQDPRQRRGAGAVPTEGTQRNRNAERDAGRIARTPLGRLGTVDDIARASSASWRATRADSRRTDAGGRRRFHHRQSLDANAGPAVCRADRASLGCRFVRRILRPESPLVALVFVTGFDPATSRSTHGAMPCTRCSPEFPPCLILF